MGVKGGSGKGGKLGFFGGGGRAGRGFNCLRTACGPPVSQEGYPFEAKKGVRKMVLVWVEDLDSALQLGVALEPRALYGASRPRSLIAPPSSEVVFFGWKTARCKTTCIPLT